MNRHTLPIPYPQIITLSLASGEQALSTEIESFIRSSPEGVPMGVNDSFSKLDLTRFGMKTLFSSSWSVRQPGTLTVDTPAELEIVPVETTDQLLEFDQACSAGFGSPDSIRVYLDSLLEDTRYTTHIGLNDGRVVTGVMAFDNGASVGIYSLFTLPEARNRGFGEAIVRSVLSKAAHLPAATNPSGMSDGLFSRLGFESHGKRTVWLTG